MRGEGETTLLRMLEPFAEAMALDDTREIVVNGPGEYAVEGSGGWTRHRDPRLTYRHMDALAVLAMRMTAQTLDAENPTGSSRLPGGQRITVTRPPMTAPGVVTATIRQRKRRFTLEWLHDRGYFSFLDRTVDWVDTLTRWVAVDRLNIEITSETGASKTSLLEALCHRIPEDERTATAESAPELFLPHWNWIPVVYDARGGTRSAEAALETLLRQRPDRLVFGETRTGETWGWIRALNTGHRGCMSTTHANPGWQGMEDTLVSQCRQSAHATGVPQEDIRRMIRDGMQVVINVERKVGDPIPYRATMIERRVA